MKNKLTMLWILNINLLFANPAPGITDLNFNGKSLHLNGTGFRTATIFKVKVYEASFYLENKTNDPQKIIDSAESKVMKMKFMRNVSTKDIQKSWNQTLRDNCSNFCSEIEPMIGTFTGFMKDVKEGDSMEYNFANDSVAIKHNDQQIGEIKNKTFAKAVLSVWFGPNPPNESLKTGLLGK